jgi:hypothetical protein
MTGAINELLEFLLIQAAPVDKFPSQLLQVTYRGRNIPLAPVFNTRASFSLEGIS